MDALRASEVKASEPGDFARALNIADLGDVGAHPYDLLATVERTAEFVKRLREHEVLPFAVGGDHVPLPVLRGLHEGEPLGMLQFDSHPDTYDEFYGTRVNHATPFRRAAEEDLLDPKRVVQLGLRGTQFSPDDASGNRGLGFTVIGYDEFEEMGREQTIARARGRGLQSGVHRLRRGRPRSPRRPWHLDPGARWSQHERLPGDPAWPFGG